MGTEHPHALRHLISFPHFLEGLSEHVDFGFLVQESGFNFWHHSYIPARKKGWKKYQKLMIVELVSFHQSSSSLLVVPFFGLPLIPIGCRHSSSEEWY